jgi:hypothetical protein
MDKAKCLTMSLAVLFIQACSSSQPPDSTTTAAKTVFDPVTQQLDKARAVQQIVDQNAENTRKAMDSQERGEPAQ